MKSVEYKTVSIQSLEPGQYKITDYDEIKCKHETYIITAEKDGKTIEFWSNSYLTQYINKVKPVEEFYIIIHRKEATSEGLSIPYPNSIEIVGYSTKTKLRPQVL